MTHVRSTSYHTVSYITLSMLYYLRVLGILAHWINESHSLKGCTEVQRVPPLEWRCFHFRLVTSPGE
jgi:hypothetical protein